MTTAAACPKCKGTMVTEYGETKCINCGFELNIRIDPLRDLETKREQVIADSLKMSTRAVAEKYGVSTLTIRRRLKAWGIQYPKMPGPAGAIVAPTSPPVFPVWSETWSDSVKVTWLQSYVQIYGVSKGGLS